MRSDEDAITTLIEGTHLKWRFSSWQAAKKCELFDMVCHIDAPDLSTNRPILKLEDDVGRQIAMEKDFSPTI